MDQHVLSHLEITSVEQRVVGREIDLWCRGSLHKIPTSRYLDRHTVVGDGTAGVTAAAQETKNAVAFLQAIHPVTHLKHHSGKLQAGDFRWAAKRRRVGTLTLEHVSTVQGRRFNVHQDIFGAGNGIIYFHYLQNVWAARFSDHCCAHECIPFMATVNFGTHLAVV